MLINVLGSVQFVGSDIPYPILDIQYKSDYLYYPSLAGAVTVIYNGKLPNGIVLSREVLVGIFNGTMQYWNDKAIQDINVLLLPPVRIVPAYRSDPSGILCVISCNCNEGTTYIFTTALSAFSQEWNDTYGAGPQIEWYICNVCANYLGTFVPTQL